MSETMTPLRRPRSAQHQKKSGPVKRRVPSSRDKKPLLPAGFPLYTVIVLALLLLIAVLALTGANGRMRRLQAQRQQEAEDYRLLVQRHTVAYRDWIERYAAQNGIEPAFAAAVILRESSYNPLATSSVGARGLMQMMPGTFEQVRKALNEDTAFEDMYDAETNIRYGCWYLGYLSRIFNGDPIEMACAYHAGPNNVKLWIMNYAADGENLQLDEIPMEDTRYYAGKVYNAYAIYFQHFYPDPV